MDFLLAAMGISTVKCNVPEALFTKASVQQTYSASLVGGGLLNRPPTHHPPMID